MFWPSTANSEAVAADSIQLFAETQRAYQHDRSSVEREDGELRPQGREAGTFQKDAPDNFQKIPQRVQVSEVLNKDRHVANRERKTAQHERGRREEKRRHNRLLLSLRDGRNEQTDTQAREQEQNRARDQKLERAAKRHMKDQQGAGGYDPHVHQTHYRERQHLSDHQFD